MKLSPLEIKKQEFARSFRGYDVEEVQAFLQMVAGQWESLMEQNRRLEEQVTELENKIEHYEKVEEALQDALETARENANQKIENAEEKADQMVREAEMKAEHIREEAQDERYAVRREVSELKHRRQEIVTRLRAFLMSEMEMLAQYEGDDPIGFVKLLPQGGHYEGSSGEEIDELEEELPSAREFIDEKRGPSDAEAGPSDAEAGPSDGPETGEAGRARGRRGDGAEGPEDEPRWRVHSVVSESPEEGGPDARDSAEEVGGEAETAASPGTDPTEELSSEEMEKIRRILDELE